MAVVAVEEAALLAPVDLVVGRVDVEHQARRPPAFPRVDERLEQHGLQRVRIMADPVVAAPVRHSGARVQAGSGCSSPPTAHSPSDVPRACRRAAPEQGSVPQLVVVVEVFVSQGDAHDALPHQRPDRVFRETGIAVVGEATCHLVQEPRRTVDLAEQQHSGVRGDRAPVERGPLPCGPGTLEMRRKAVYTVSASVLRCRRCQVLAPHKLNSSRRPVPSYAFEKSGLEGRKLRASRQGKRSEG